MKTIENQSAEMLSLDALAQVTGGAGSGSEAASGSFASNTGTALNLLVSWRALDIGGGQRNLEVTVSTTSYSLSSAMLANGVELHVNGAQYLADSAPVNYRGSGMATNLLASFRVQVPAGTVSLSAVWHFKGSYSGTPISSITATGTATV